MDRGGTHGFQGRPPTNRSFLRAVFLVPFCFDTVFSAHPRLVSAYKTHSSTIERIIDI